MYLFFSSFISPTIFNNFRETRNEHFSYFIYNTCRFRSEKMGNRYNRKNLHVNGLNKNSEYGIWIYECMILVGK